MAEEKDHQDLLSKFFSVISGPYLKHSFSLMFTFPAFGVFNGFLALSL
jgi:hypothetical protein